MVKSNVNLESEQPKMPDKVAVALAIFTMLQELSIEDASEVLVVTIANFLEAGCKEGEALKAMSLLADSAIAKWNILQEVKKEIKKKKSK